MPQTQLAPRHLTAIRLLDIRQVQHQQHGYVDWCLHCLAEDKAGTMPTNAKELGFKGRSWSGR